MAKQQNYSFKTVIFPGQKTKKNKKRERTKHNHDIRDNDWIDYILHYRCYISFFMIDLEDVSQFDLNIISKCQINIS